MWKNRFIMMGWSALGIACLILLIAAMQKKKIKL